jgi:hypothetical protein
MSTNERKSTKGARGKSVAEGSKPESKPKAERPNLPAGRQGRKAVSVPNTNKSEIENGEALNEVNPTSEIKNSEALNEVSKSEIEHPKSEITQMEVHHHPQLEHKPKPWKEYLLEGFMIFIAVMMGFIAENIRQDITNGEQARQLTLQLVQDLKADTAQLNYIYAEESQIVKYNDTLFNLLQQPLKNMDNRRIQKLAANSHSMWPFHPSSGAIAAIKNELHLKQFSNSKIISYFSGYERDIELLHTAQDINLQYQRIYLDPFITLHFTPKNMVAAFSDLPVPTTQMRNLSQGDIDKLAADMVLIRIVSKEMVRDNRGLKNDAADMLHYVIKQYQLDGE